MNDYNRHFAKAPRREFDVHRDLDVDDDLGIVFNWREARKVSKSLTVQYDKVLYLIEDSESVVGRLVNTLMSGITQMGIKNSGLSAYHFPTPPMTNCLKSIRVPLWTINALAVHWTWHNWYKSKGIITDHSLCHLEMVFHAGVKPP